MMGSHTFVGTGSYRVVLSAGPSYLLQLLLKPAGPGSARLVLMSRLYRNQHLLRGTQTVQVSVAPLQSQAGARASPAVSARPGHWRTCCMPRDADELQARHCHRPSASVFQLQYMVLDCARNVH